MFKIFQNNTNSVILKYLWVGHLPHLSRVIGPLVELKQKLALRVSPTITDLYYRAYVTEALVRQIPGLSVPQMLTCVLSDVIKANLNLRDLNVICKIAYTKYLPQTSRSAK